MVSRDLVRMLDQSAARSAWQIAPQVGLRRQQGDCRSRVLIGDRTPGRNRSPTRLIRWAMNHVAANAAAMGGALRATAVGFISVLSRLPSHPVNTKTNTRAMILILVNYPSSPPHPTIPITALTSPIPPPP